MPRTVIRDPSFEYSAKSIFGSVQDADELLRMIEWFLARQPSFSGFSSLGTLPSKALLYFYKSKPNDCIKPVVVTFTVSTDDSEITLMNVFQAKHQALHAVAGAPPQKLAASDVVVAPDRTKK